MTSQVRAEGLRPPCPRHPAASPRIIRQNLPFYFRAPVMSGHLVGAEALTEQVGETLLDLTEVTEKTKAAIADVASQAEYDLAVYFDYKFGDALEAAKRLQSSSDKNDRYVAETLLRQSDAILSSKAAWQNAVKQS